MSDTKVTSISSILDDAVAVACERPGADTGARESLRELMGRYYRHIPEVDIASQAPADLAGSVLSHRHLASKRKTGQALVRVFNPSLEHHGWQTGHTVVEICTDDMPFLVDSVTAELSRQNRAIHTVVHPTLLVRRDEEGNLIEVLNQDAAYGSDNEGQAQWPADAVVESWMHIEIDVESDETDRMDLEDDVARILGDVRSAVNDWPNMRERALEVAAGLKTAVPSDLQHEVRDAERLLAWLADNHFTFLGYREYRLDTSSDTPTLEAVPGSGLGVLRQQDPAPVAGIGIDQLAAPVRERMRDRSVMILTKANSRATVHRPVYLDYVGIKTFDASGNVVGEQRFLGLLSSTAYTQSVRTIPVIDDKVSQVMEKAGFAPNSHSAKDMLILLETYPRDELFQMSSDELYETATSVMHLQERRQTRVFLRRDRYGRFASCLVFLPRDRYTTRVRVGMQRILKDFFNADSVDFSTRLSESVLARLHFVARAAKGELIADDLDTGALEAELTAATRSWEEHLGDSMTADVGEEEAARILHDWEDVPEAYKENYDPRLATIDLRRLQTIMEDEGTTKSVPSDATEGKPVDGLIMNLYQPLGAGPDRSRFKVYCKEALSLTTVLPLFRNLGVEVTEQRPHELRRKDGRVGYIYDFGLKVDGEVLKGARERFTEAFAASWIGASESDGLDRLVLHASLTWRQVVILRSITKYLRQGDLPFSQEYIEGTLLDHSDIARALVHLFEARFNPDLFNGEGEREGAVNAVTNKLNSLLEGVSSLDADRIFRAFSSVIKAAVRTNFYQRNTDGSPKSYVSLKVQPQQIPSLPEPRPAFEIWVYSRRVEGVHLRYGAVARGGLRWSDRREDFRTEVLGLVKAQMVKNSVIVPTGAKGGFFAKQLPDMNVDRDAWFAEGVASYQTFISALLDITDNLAPSQEDGTRPVIAPDRVVRHDGDDPYLVVAADKGTATFSDIANGVSEAYGHWLGDAFASGGSVGYDHKAMGITARGAWESVKRHFREIGVDTQTQDFTAVGVGDMSGDVFGNGMLLSKHIRLVAAFDHRHIFIDPNPVASTSYVERERLFALPRSSWEDYDTSLISEGGGVFSRKVKSIDITPQIREALGIADSVESMSPLELIKAVLLAPVDLLWNGGIGTYIKSSEQTHASVGDRSNDSIRLDGNELRVKVIGEGGNLGLTQLGRIEAAANGVMVNTDAIDNSAGVDCSDHEVNIKIFLDQVVTQGDMTVKQRNNLLADMTDEVSRLVLRDNIDQNILLGNGRKQAPHMLPVHQRLIKHLEATGDLDRELEFLPSDKEIGRREAEGIGLTSPELSVLVAYAKITLERAIAKSDLVGEPWFKNVLRDYFPKQMIELFGEQLQEHPLAHAIIATAVTNELINRGGITFVHRGVEETGADMVDLTRAFVVSRTIFGMHDFMEQVDNLPVDTNTDVQTEMYLEYRRLLDRSVRWFVNNRPAPLNVQEECDRFGAFVGRHMQTMPQVLVGTERQRLATQAKSLTDRGIPQELAELEAGLLDSFSLLDIYGIIESFDVSEELAVKLYFLLSERYTIDELLNRVALLNRQNRWNALARAALRDDLYAALESLTTVVIEHDVEAARAEHTDVTKHAMTMIESWEAANTTQLQRVRGTLKEVQDLEVADLATMSVVLRQLRAVVRTGTN